MEQQGTPVIYRTDKKDGNVIAVFPTLVSDVAGHFMTCYTHTAQHGGCSGAWMRKDTRPATADEAAPMATELAQVGYTDLRPVRRITAAMARARMERAR